MAPRLHRLFQQVFLRTHFDTFDLAPKVAPSFSSEYDRLLGKLYNDDAIKASLVAATQVAVRLCASLALYPDIKFQYAGLMPDMVVDLFTGLAPASKAWTVVLPAVTTVDSLGVELILHRAVVYDDGAGCCQCSRCCVQSGRCDLCTVDPDSVTQDEHAP